MINIMYAGNYKVFDGILLSSMSILKHTSEPITAYILTMDRTEENPKNIAINNAQIDYLQKLYSQKNPKNQVVKVDVAEVFDKEIGSSPNNNTQYTVYTLLRLISDKIDIIPDKIIYLDTDTMAYNDISQLYNIDISDYEIGAVKDYYGKKFFTPRYCNAGMLLMNMAKIRETGMLERAAKMCTEKKIFLSDQTAINKCTKKKLILPSKFNEQHKLHKDTVIRHFSMTLKFFPIFRKRNIKPWNIEGMHNILKCHEFDDILNEYIRRKPEINSLLDDRMIAFENGTPITSNSTTQNKPDSNINISQNINNQTNVTSNK